MKASAHEAALVSARQMRATNPLTDQPEKHQPLRMRRKRQIPSATTPGLVLEASISDWEGVADYDSRLMQKRRTDALVMADRRCVGQMIFNEFRCRYLLEDRDLYWEMDGDSRATFDLAKVFLAGWHASDLFVGAPSLATILEFNALWMEPAFARNSLWYEFADRLIKQARNAGVLLFKPFPLEMSSDAGAAVSDVAIDRRCRALRRLYERTLGGRILPGDPEWMYCPLKLTKPPFRRPRKLNFRSSF